MKTIILATLLICGTLKTHAQHISASEAKTVYVSLMATFTEKVSFAYSKGISLQTFTSNLLTRPTDNPEGNKLLEHAYNYLSRSATREQIIKEDNGKVIASALGFLVKLHAKETEPDGAELFGNTDAIKIADQKEKCRWYQLLCHLTQLYIWIVGWPDIESFPLMFP